MKKNIKRFISVIVTVVFIGFGIHQLGYYLRAVQTDIAIDAINTFHNMPDNTFEVMGFGSSHIWRGMNPMELYDKYGIGAYNYGCNWQRINTTLLFLKDALTTQKPKVVLLETYMINSYKEDQDMDGEIYYTTAIKESHDKQVYLKQVFGNDKERYLSYYMPLCAFHDNWINISEQSFNKDLYNTYDFYKTMGFVADDEKVSVSIPDHNTFKQEDLSDGAVAILDEIVSVCKENGADIVFFTVPYQDTFAYSDAMKEYAAENDSVYFDLFENMEQIGIDCDTDFSDPVHLNTSGANKVADFLGDYLADNYDLTDFRNVKNNIWEKYQTD